MSVLISPATETEISEVIQSGKAVWVKTSISLLQTQKDTRYILTAGSVQAAEIFIEGEAVK